MSKTNKFVPAPEASREGCRAIAEILSRIGDKWTVLVVANLSSGKPLRYNQLRRKVEGISQRMLTLTLKGLEQDGIVSRKLYPSVPPRVDYELTLLGHKLVVPLTALYEWAVEHRSEILASREQFETETRFSNFTDGSSVKELIANQPIPIQRGVHRDRQNDSERP